MVRRNRGADETTLAFWLTDYSIACTCTAHDDAMRIAALSTALALLLGVSLAESNLTTSQSSQQVLQGDFKPPQVWENTNLVRTTNLEKGYVRETINVVVTNKDSKPQTMYYFPFDYGHKAQIGGFEVRDKKNAEKGKFEVTTAALGTALGDITSPQVSQDP